LTHSTSPLFMMNFFLRWCLLNYLSRRDSNHGPLDLCLLSS
jgi:hypothetical protein